MGEDSGIIKRFENLTNERPDVSMHLESLAECIDVWTRGLIYAVQHTYIYMYIFTYACAHDNIYRYIDFTVHNQATQMFDLMPTEADSSLVRIVARVV